MKYVGYVTCPLKVDNFAMLKLYWEHQCWNWRKTKLLVIDWVENIYSCSSSIKTLKLVWKDLWLLQGGIVINVYSKYTDMPLKHLHSIVGALNVKEKLIQGNDVSVQSLKCKKFECSSVIIHGIYRSYMDLLTCKTLIKPLKSI